MGVKDLDDFKDSSGSTDYQGYADYLESAQCIQDAGIDVVADEKGNIYTPTEGDWNKGHGHTNVFNGYDRKPEDPDSYGRSWYNKWLKERKEYLLNIKNELLQLKTNVASEDEKHIK